MKILLLAVFLLSISSPPGHAGQPVITETDTGITVEYTGNPEDTPAVTNGKGASAEIKPTTPAASGALTTTPQESREATSEEMEARRAQREALRAERAARRIKREPRGARSGGEE